MQEKGRLGHIDISRGIMAILVIVGHLVPFNEFTWLSIFAYHMPFFFIISGFCTNRRSVEKRFFPFLFHSATSILLPALFIRLFQFIAYEQAASTTLLEYLLNPHTEWFTPALFLARLLLYIYCRFDSRLSKKPYKYILGLLTVACALFTAAWINQEGLHLKPSWFPIQIDSALIGFAFAIVGFYLRDVDIVELTHKISKKAALIIGIGVGIILWFVKNSAYTNICDIALGRSDLFYFIAACFLSVVTLMLSVYLYEGLTAATRPKRLAGFFSNTLQLIGRSSLFFYIGHCILFHFFNKYFSELLGREIVPMFDFPIELIIIYTALALLILTPLAFIKELIYKLPSCLKRIKIHKQWVTALGALLCVGAIFLFNNGTLRLAPKYEKGLPFDPIIIDSEEAFISFRDSVNAGESYEDKYILQAVDLDLSDIESFEPIGIYNSGSYFMGTYDGGGHVIRNLRMVRSDNCGLFGMLGGTVRNLGIEGGYIEGGCIGSIASHATGSHALISNCFSTATLKGWGRAGGIADNFNGTIQSCWSDVQLWSPSGAVGGIVSYSAFELDSCYSIGTEPITDNFAGKDSRVEKIAEGSEALSRLADTMNYRMSAKQIFTRKAFYRVKDNTLCFSEKADVLNCTKGILIGTLETYNYELLLIALIIGTVIYFKKARKKQ